MLPEGFIKRIESQKYIDSQGLFRALQESSPTSIRLNPTKWNRIPSGSQLVPWCSEGYYLPDRPSFTFDPLFHSGCYYPQEASSMFIGEVFHQLAGDQEYLRVLDLCGAPGGKSTHLASLIGKNGLLVSNEVIRTRASILSENIAKWGIPNTIVTNNDPSVFGRMEGFFDIIIVDAPCSGEGMFRDKLAVSEWSEQSASHCAERQKRILSDTWPALKAGGYLIYSTCTFNPGENEENVKWLSDNRSSVSVRIDKGDFRGISHIDHYGIHGYGFYPGKIKGDGLFVSVLRKDTDASQARNLPSARMKNKLRKQDLKQVKEWTNFPQENLIRIGDEIFCIPGKESDHSLIEQTLRVVRPGTRICSVKKDLFIPAHDLVMSQGLRKEAFDYVEADYGQAVEYLRKNIVAPVSIAKGFFILKYRGVNLGFCNNLGKRVNNYYPVEWRIRLNRPAPEMNTIISWND